MYVCMHVCMCVIMYVCLYIYIHMFMSVSQLRRSQDVVKKWTVFCPLVGELRDPVARI